MNAFNNFQEDGLDLQIFASVTPYDCVQLQSGYSAIRESINGNSYGLQDFECTWQREFATLCNNQFFLQAVAIIPAGPPKASLRYGRFGVELNLGLINNCFWSHFYYQARLGYRSYHGFPSDQFRADGGLGVCLIPHLFLQTYTVCEYGLFNGSKAPYFSLIAFNPNYRLLQLGAEAVYRVYAQAYLSIGYDWHVWGANVGTGGGLTARGWVIF